MRRVRYPCVPAPALPAPGPGHAARAVARRATRAAGARPGGSLRPVRPPAVRHPTRGPAVALGRLRGGPVARQRVRRHGVAPGRASSLRGSDAPVPATGSHGDVRLRPPSRARGPRDRHVRARRCRRRQRAHGRDVDTNRYGHRRRAPRQRLRPAVERQRAPRHPAALPVGRRRAVALLGATGRSRIHGRRRRARPRQRPSGDRAAQHPLLDRGADQRPRAVCQPRGEHLGRRLRRLAHPGRRHRAQPARDHQAVLRALRRRVRRHRRRQPGDAARRLRRVPPGGAQRDRRHRARRVRFVRDLRQRRGAARGRGVPLGGVGELGDGAPRTGPSVRGLLGRVDGRRVDRDDGAGGSVRHRPAGPRARRAYAAALPRRGDVRRRAQGDRAGRERDRRGRLPDRADRAARHLPSADAVSHGAPARGGRGVGPGLREPGTVRRRDEHGPGPRHGGLGRDRGSLDQRPAGGRRHPERTGRHQRSPRGRLRLAGRTRAAVRDERRELLRAAAGRIVRGDELGPLPQLRGGDGEPRDHEHVHPAARRGRRDRAHRPERALRQGGAPARWSGSSWTPRLAAAWTPEAR